MNNTAVSEALQQGVRPPGIDASQCLKDFDDHLTRVQGLAPRTRQGYCFWVSRFLARFCALDAPDWSSLRAEHVTTFVQQEASRLHRYSRAIPGTAIRALLRYLTFLGVTRSGLEAAVPRMPRWKHAELPRYPVGHMWESSFNTKRPLFSASPRSAAACKQSARSPTA